MKVRRRTTKSTYSDVRMYVQNARIRTSQKFVYEQKTTYTDFVYMFKKHVYGKLEKFVEVHKTTYSCFRIDAKTVACLIPWRLYGLV